MAKFILRRLVMIAISVVAVITISFFLLEKAPGSFIELSMLRAQQINSGATGSGVVGTDPTVVMWQERYGPEKSVLEKSIIFVRYAVVGDLGPSFRLPANTIEELIARALPNTFILVLCSLSVSLIVGIPLGIIAALNRNSALDRVVMFVSMVGQTIPSYVLAVVFILAFAVKIKLLPTSGWGSPEYLVLPVASLAIGPIAGLARYVRNSMISVFTEDYVRTAYAKGGTTRLVVMRHALRNSLIPLITVVGPQFASMMVGSVWIETMFNIPGLGRLFSSAAPTRDYPLVIASAAFFALLVMMMNLLVDIGYAILDPRIRQEFSSLEG